MNAKKRIYSAERNKKISNSLLGKPLSSSHRINISLAQGGKGIIRSKDKLNLCQCGCGQACTNRFVAGHNLRILGPRAKSVSEIKQTSKALRTFYQTEQGLINRKQKTEQRKLDWQRPEYRKQILGIGKKQNKAEKQIHDILNEIQPEIWKYTGQGKVLIIDSMMPDFWNGGKKVIELYGDYWHNKDNPQERIDYFAKHGYQCFIIWEHELNDLDVLTSKLKSFCYEV